ncbi:MAG TPA: hypothetical protein VIH47_04745 [Solirubrobacterales bacterium]
MNSDQPKVVVLGAQGALGRLCAPALRRVGLDVVRAGRRPESTGDFRLIDVRDAVAVERGCADADLVVSMVNDPTHTVERFVLETGAAMLTAIVEPPQRAELKALGTVAKGLVVTDVGVGPGVTSLVLADLLDRHPDADELEGAGTWSMTEPYGRDTVEVFLHPGLTNEKRRRTALVEFPEPFGTLHCLAYDDEETQIAVAGDLALKLPVQFYGYTLEGWARIPVNALNSLGLISKVPLSFLTLGLEKRAASTVAKPQAHLCAVRRDGKRLETQVVLGNGNLAMSAAAIATCAKVLLDRRAEGDSLSGVRGVEDVFRLSEVRGGFEEQGIRIEAMG